MPLPKSIAADIVLMVAASLRPGCAASERRVSAGTIAAPQIACVPAARSTRRTSSRLVAALSPGLVWFARSAMRAPQPPAPSAKVCSSMKKPDQGGVALRRPEHQAAALGRDEIVAGLLQLVARVGDQAGLVEAIGAQQEAEVAAAARVFGEGDGEAGELLERIEAGAALEFGERLLVGLRFDRERLDLGGGRAGAQLADVDARDDARRGGKQGEAPLDRQRRVGRRCRAGSRRGTTRWPRTRTGGVAIGDALTA